MTTLIAQARKGKAAAALKSVAREEKIHAEELLSLVAKGQVVIPLNARHPRLRPLGIGRKLRTKVNVNIGTSRDFPGLTKELKKVDIALKYGTDAIMDLSTGGNLRKIRKAILDRAPIPLGTVPVYQAAIEAIENRGSILAMTVDDLFGVIESQALEGVDFMTVHCGLTSKAIDRLKKQGRVADVVSRGGAFHLAWILHHGKENPLYEHFDRLLDIARAYDITLSLGDGLRPGSIHDATDRPQIEELLTLGELVERAWERDVQVMVEGPGHVPLNQVEMNVTSKSGSAGKRRFMSWGLLSRISARATTISSRPSAARSPRLPARISSAMSLRPNIWACLPPKTSGKVLSLPE